MGQRQIESDMTEPSHREEAVRTVVGSQTSPAHERLTQNLAEARAEGRGRHSHLTGLWPSTLIT